MFHIVFHVGCGNNDSAQRLMLQADIPLVAAVTLPSLGATAPYFTPSPPPPALTTSESASAATSTPSAGQVASCLNQIISSNNLTGLPMLSPARLLSNASADPGIITLAEVSFPPSASQPPGRISDLFAASACPEIDARATSAEAILEGVQFDMEQASLSLPDFSLSVGVRVCAAVTFTARLCVAQALNSLGTVTKSVVARPCMSTACANWAGLFIAVMLVALQLRFLY